MQVYVLLALNAEKETVSQVSLHFTSMTRQLRNLLVHFFGL